MNSPFYFSYTSDFILNIRILYSYTKYISWIQGTHKFDPFISKDGN